MAVQARALPTCPSSLRMARRDRGIPRSHCHPGGTESRKDAAANDEKQIEHTEHAAQTAPVPFGDAWAAAREVACDAARPLVLSRAGSLL
eukprot:scaffold323616_cov36-Tisochrysis_lutea.AAC.2